MLTQYHSLFLSKIVRETFYKDMKLREGNELEAASLPGATAVEYGMPSP
jgi:hypothetical protein